MTSSRTSLESILEIISGNKNKKERLSLAHLGLDARRVLSDSLAPTIRLARSDKIALDSETSFFIAMRLLWSLVPEALFSRANPDFESLAASTLRTRFGGGLCSEVEGYLAIVYRRLRDARRRGRTVARLDLDRRVHHDLFDEQGRRCATCGYCFVADDFIYTLDDDEEVYVADHHAEEGEVTLSKYYRRPVLDHIIPYYLGGDRPENWQILCQCCNAGKGESLSWLTRRSWVPASKISDLFTLTAGLRYSVLADYLSTNPLPAAGRELRIFRRDPELLVHFDNLECRV